MMNLSRARRAVLTATAVMFLSLSGLASAGALAGQTETTPPTEAPAPTEPPATQPPATEPPVTEAPPATDTTSSTTDEDTVRNDNLGSIVLIVILGLGLAAIIGALAGRRGSNAPQGAAGPSASSPKRELLANVRWLHDQLSPRLASEPPEWASQQWAADRYRVENLAVTAQTFSSGAGGGTWHRLSSAINDTVEALDACTATRGDPRATPEEIRHAVALLNENRTLLMRSAEVAASITH